MRGVALMWWVVVGAGCDAKRVGCFMMGAGEMDLGYIESSLLLLFHGE